MADYETLHVCPVPYCQQCVKFGRDPVTQLHFITIFNVFSLNEHIKYILNDGERVNLEVEKISKEEVRENMKRMKNGKAVGPGDIPVDVWKCLG